MMICCGYGCIICLRNFFFRPPFCTYPTNITTIPMRNRKPERLYNPVAPIGKPRMNSISPKMNVKRGFQDDFGRGT